MQAFSAHNTKVKTLSIAMVCSENVSITTVCSFLSHLSSWNCHPLPFPVNINNNTGIYHSYSPLQR